MSQVFFSDIESPIGVLRLTSNGVALIGLDMLDPTAVPDPNAHWRRDDVVLGEARAQLRAYFARERTHFELEIAFTGTPFQIRVWEALQSIPYGTTISYGALARRIGQPAATRAVGLANGRNPIAIVVPCHRVIGADGSLTGYGGGLARKRVLLELESSRQDVRRQRRDGQTLPLPGFA